MAGVAWGNYSRNDWERVPGGSRRFRLRKDHAVTISRRQFDEHYGSAAAFGTYERKAKKNIGTREQLLRPARGRTSARRLGPEDQEKELGRRRVARAESKQQKTIQRLQSKRIRNPTKITLRNFHKGKQIRKFRTDINHAEIESLRKAAASSGIVLGYWVGLEMVSERDGGIIHISIFSMRDIKMSFTIKDFQRALQKSSERTYAVLTGMFIAMHLTKAAAIKNGARKN